MATTKDTRLGGSTSKGFTAEEKAAMKQRAKEMKAEERAKNDRAAGEKAAVDAIAAMSQPDQGMARRIHEIIKATTPDLWPKTWYGMPAYAKDGKIVCFYQPAEKFGARYGTLGFNDSASLDDGDMWPVAFAIMKLGEAEEKKITALIKKAVK